MSNPLIHAKSSVKRFGGQISDYLPLHELLDSPKCTMNNNTSRMMTHNTWFAYTIIPKIFGFLITNSDGKSVDTVDIAALHIIEDFKMSFFPTPQDYLKHMTLEKWMCNGIKAVDNPESVELAKQFLEKIRQ